MAWQIVRVVVSVAVIIAVSEVASRSSTLGAVLASIPLVSVLGMMWLYLDTGETETVAALSRDIVWLVIPSLVLFVLLPILLERDWGFWTALATSIAATVGCYLLTIAAMSRLRGG